MLLTEEEAKKRWCPHTRMATQTSDKVFNRVWVEEDKAKNQDGYMWRGPGVCCIASTCMAWNWASEKALRDIDLITSDIEAESRTGYCGLSGPAKYGD